MESLSPDSSRKFTKSRDNAPPTYTGESHGDQRERTLEKEERTCMYVKGSKLHVNLATADLTVMGDLGSALKKKRQGYCVQKPPAVSF